MESISIDQLLLDCKDIKISECLSKLAWKGSKLQRSLFTKLTKDNLCDSLIFIAEKLFASTGTTEEKQIIDNSSSNTQQPTQNSGEDLSTEDSISNEEQATQNEDGETLNNSSTNGEDNRPVCRLFCENRCPTGIKGQKCNHQHPKQCRKFLQGGRTEHGCQDWKCQLLHPKICSNAYLFGSCYKTGCKERHTKDHQMLKKRTEDQGKQSFLWQKQIQEQIDKLANTNLQILKVLNQCQQRPIQVWNQAPQQQTPLPRSPPRWGATNSQ
jgi:hypothetical protein